MLPLSRITAVIALSLMVLCTGAHAQQSGQKAAPDPLRLSYTEGDVSFWREGAQDWVKAQLNTPLAAGDALYAGNDSDLELQMGSRAFIRAASDSQLTLVNQTADFTQFKITTGRVAFDLRMLPAGHTIEVDTPNAVFTIDHIGYYRVDVDGEVRFITRRGGQAIVVPAGGEAMGIRPSEEVVVQGGEVAKVETYVAPELDRWDRWNYARTDGQVDTVSERYLSPGIAGAYDLDQYGDWRVVPQYGSVWVPSAVPAGWSPYSAGRWVWDPYYQWTWIDDAPWGWAPFHYGRWIYLSGYWAWVPGPVIRYAVYAPALVAFFGIGANVSVGVSFGGGLGWVALGWGEPLVPWWGPSVFIGRPWWGGWGGPRVVNNVVIQRNTVINVTNINYINTHVSNAVITARQENFGRGRAHGVLGLSQTGELKQIRGALPVKPGPASLVADTARGIQPPERALSRSVVTARPSPEHRLPWRAGEAVAPARAAERHVALPKRPVEELPQPGFGSQTGAERPRPPQPPRFEERRRETGPAAAGGGQRAPGQQVEPTRPHTPSELPSHPSREQPGRMAPEPNRGEIVRPPREQPSGRATPELNRGEVGVPPSRERPSGRTAPEFNRGGAGARPPEVFRPPERRERGPLPGRSANQMYHQQGSVQPRGSGEHGRH